MYVENANRAAKEGVITPDNLEPNPKNPLIAAFFRTIGWSDQLGSGVRNLYHYSRFYSGKEPEFIEGDVFRIVVPLDESYSYDFGTGSETIPETKSKHLDPLKKHRDYFFETNAKKALAYIEKDPSITQAELKDKLQISLMSVKRIMKVLQENGQIERKGSSRKGYWKIIK